MRNGPEVHQGRKIQAFMVFEGALYDYTLDSTLTMLNEIGIDSDLFTKTTYNDRPTYIIGARLNDFSTNQVWLDAERRHLVRRFQKSKSAGTVEVQYSDHRFINGHYVESFQKFFIDDQLIQTERYSNIKANENLDPTIFDRHGYKENYWYKALGLSMCKSF